MMIAEQIRKIAIIFLEKEASSHALTEYNLDSLKGFIFCIPFRSILV